MSTGKKSSSSWQVFALCVDVLASRDAIGNDLGDIALDDESFVRDDRVGTGEYRPWLRDEMGVGHA